MQLNNVFGQQRKSHTRQSRAHALCDSYRIAFLYQCCSSLIPGDRVWLFLWEANELLMQIKDKNDRLMYGMIRTCINGRKKLVPMKVGISSLFMMPRSGVVNSYDKAFLAKYMYLHRFWKLLVQNGFQDRRVLDFNQMILGELNGRIQEDR